MYIKNAAASVPFALISASTGAALTGATVTARRSLDGAAQATASGSVAELANGQYVFSAAAADMNGDVVGLLFTATGAIPVHVTIRTVAAAVITAGTGTGQLSTTSGGVLVAAYASGQAPLQPTTAGRTLDVTVGGEAGIDWANVGSPTTTLNLSGTTVKAVTDAVTAGTVSDKSGYALSAAGVDAIWDEAQSGHATAGTFGLFLDAAVTSRLAPTTAGRTLDVTATGEAGIDWANIGGSTTTVNLSGTTIKTATDVEADSADIQARLPAALVSGRIDASVGAIAANTMTASALATDAVTEIVNGVAARYGISSTVSDASPAAGDFTAAAGLSASDNYYNGAMLKFSSGALNGIARKISQYVGASRQFLFTGAAGTLDAPFPTAPADTDAFDILGRG